MAWRSLVSARAGVLGAAGVVVRLVELLARHVRRADQGRDAVARRLGIDQGGLRGLQARLGGGGVVLICVGLGAGFLDRGRALGDDKLERHGIDGGELVALPDRLIVGHMHGNDAAGDLRRYGDEVGADIGVASIGNEAGDHLIGDEQGQKAADHEGRPLAPGHRGSAVRLDQSSRWTRSMRSCRSCASIDRVAMGRASSRRRPIGSSVSSQ
jgi:hypothetical protein